MCCGCGVENLHPNHMPDLDRPPGGPDPLSAELVRLQWEAELQFNSALAQFQAAVIPASGPSLAAIVESARPAFAAGFCYLVRQDGDGFEVILRHKAGAEEASSADAATYCSPALLLAGLLGIPVAMSAQASEHDQTEEPEAAPEPAPVVGSEPPEPVADAVPAVVEEPDLMGPDSPPDRPGDHPSLAPLTQGQIDAAIEMIRVMPVATRKTFTIAFRNAFEIDSNVQKVSGEIKQVRHLEFIDRFTVEAAGGIAP